MKAKISSLQIMRWCWIAIHLFSRRYLIRFRQRAISSKTEEIAFLREEMVRLKRNLEGQLEKANEGAERSAASAQAASQELEERRAAMDRTRGELDECRRRLEQLGVDGPLPQQLLLHKDSLLSGRDGSQVWMSTWVRYIERRLRTR